MQRVPVMTREGWGRRVGTTGRSCQQEQRRDDGTLAAAHSFYQMIYDVGMMAADVRRLHIHLIYDT